MHFRYTPKIKSRLFVQTVGKVHKWEGSFYAPLSDTTEGSGRVLGGVVEGELFRLSRYLDYLLFYLVFPTVDASAPFRGH